MVSGTLYTYNGSHQAYKILITAGYSGAEVKLADFEFGKTNTSDAFLQKFPLGRVPAFEDANGHHLSETNAITRYLSNEQLKGGSNAIDQALVQQYIDFADHEIQPSACAWTYPTLGFKQYNKQDTEKAMTHIKKCMDLLNNLLLGRTFLVGERVTLADISLCCNFLSLYVQVLDPKFREAYGNVNRWFLTCINQPAFKKVLGEIKLCEKMAVFDNKKYQELHPKQQKKATKESKPKEQPKKEEKVAKPEAEEPPPKPKKIDYFADVPKSDFVLDDWKKMYSNNEVDVSTPWLWNNFDNNAWSFWYCEYQYNDECTVDFLSMNLIGGFYQRIEGLRKHAFANMLLVKSDKEEHFCLRGVWMLRGKKLAFSLNPDWNVDAEQYTFRPLDPVGNAEDKKLVNNYLEWEGDLFTEYKVKDGHTFK